MTIRNLRTSPAILRGNTCRGVNKEIIEYLLRSGHKYDGKAILDIPCGDGDLMSSLRHFFPKAVVKGCDVQIPKTITNEDFSRVDANYPFKVFPETKFDAVLCVSGVCEFDNTLQFFTHCKDHLVNDGLFVVTNDNAMSLRDRIAYFWLGRHVVHGLFVLQEYCSWKMIPMSNMVRILQDSGFRIREIRYVSVKKKDYLMLPFALLVYPIQFLYMQFRKSGMPVAMRHAMYPFRSLIFRHYIIFCEKGAV